MQPNELTDGEKDPVNVSDSQSEPKPNFDSEALAASAVAEESRVLVPGSEYWLG